MDEKKKNHFASSLHHARLNARPLDHLSSQENFNLKEAYAIQEQGIELRLAEGEKIIGRKMGLTSEAKRKQMNLNQPVYGTLTDKMQVKKTLDLTGTIHPKIEPEIAFLIGKDLSGNVGRNDVLDACTGICAAMEILDSRYRHFKYFSIEDVVADNSSSCYFILGEIQNPSMDVRGLKMKMTDGHRSLEGVSDAISKDPVISVIHQCELLHQRNEILPAGSIVLAGAATTAIELTPDMRVELVVENMGTVVLQTK